MINVALKKTGLFFSASLIGGIIALIISFTILGQTDPKYSDAPLMGQETEILGLLVIASIGSLLYLIAIFLNSSHSSFHVLRDRSIMLSGLIYFPFLLLFTFILKLLINIESMIFVVFTWSVLIAYPIIIGLISNQSFSRNDSS